MSGTSINIADGDADDDKPVEFIGSFEKGLLVINALAHSTKGMTLSEVAVATGTTRSTARRYLITLESLGYADQVSRRFELTRRILDLVGSRFDAGLTWQISQPLIEALAAELGESCTAFVQDGNEVVCVAEASAPRLLAVRMPVGTRLPILSSAAGRAILAEASDPSVDAIFDGAPVGQMTPFTKSRHDQLFAEIEQVRKHGFALVDQELEIGLRSIAVPVRNRMGQTVGALMVSADCSRVEVRTMIEDFLDPLNRASASISGHTNGV